MTDLDRVTSLAEGLIRRYLDANVWSFGFDRARRRAGQCNFTDRRITVSRFFASAHNEQEIEQILLHEIAHALAGARAGHGPEWRKIAREIGYEGRRTTSLAIDTSDAPWVGICDGGHRHTRYRRPSGVYRCRSCASERASGLIRWERNS